MSWLLRQAGREHVVLDRRDDAGRRLAGPLGRLPPGDAELDDVAARLSVRRGRAGRIHDPRRGGRPVPPYAE